LQPADAQAPPPPGSGYSPAGSVSYAGFGKRLGAYILDILILVVPIVAILIMTVFGAIAQVLTTNGTAAHTPSSLYVGSVAIAVILLAYFGLLVGSMGSTLGQRILGLHVVSVETGQRLPMLRALLRSAIFWVGSFVGIVISGLGTVFSLVFLLSCIWCLWDPRKQTLHDKLGKALVIQ
jgi:uncharacterized RDD family membrane protein YckC